MENIINLEITDTTLNGSGVARDETGRVVFVEGAVKGDVVEATVFNTAKKYINAGIVKIIKPSPYRKPKECGFYQACGGCIFRHIDYSHELEIKENHIKNTLIKIAGLNIEPKKIVSGREEHYRNKVIYTFSGDENGQITCGFYSNRSHSVTAVTDCLICDVKFEPVKNVVLSLLNSMKFTVYDPQNHKGLLRSLYLRSNKQGQVSVCLVINGTDTKLFNKFAEKLLASCPDVSGFYININTIKTNLALGQKTFLVTGGLPVDELCGRRFRISPNSFYQVNRDMAEKLYDTARNMIGLKDGDVLLDLYCGVGTIGLSLTDEKKLLFGVDNVKEAINDARQNAKINGQTGNTYFLCGDAGEGIRECKKLYKKIDAVVVDPPRKGLDISVIRNIAAERIEKLLYISCNPDTLARDLRHFTDKKYIIREIIPFDLFPGTGHVECVVLMTQ